ncbi:MAG: tryptophan--tRNA ligase [Candidatus Saccharibacteria bacterium]
MSKPVILTGLRANNDLTIGNYFGGILPMVDMAKTKSDEFQINMFIPDLHSFTTPIDHSQLLEQVLNNARLFVAAGLPLNNDSIFLYRQSYIPAHSELTWILDCFTGFGEMNRMTQFKDKGNSTGSDRTSMGLFNYPVLMAADILLYNAQYVPVGDDQSQHLEFTRDIAERINKRFGDVFTIPEAVGKQHEFFGKDQGLRIMDLADPTKKMSKSDDSGKGVIFLGDDPEVAAKKVMSATTDDKAEIHFDKVNQPGISNLLEILALLRGKAVQEVTAEFEGQTQYGAFKQVVADEVRQFLTNFQVMLASVDDSAIMSKIEQSERDAAVTANATLLRVQQAVGLRPKDQ